MSFIQKMKSLRHEAYLACCHALPIQQNKIILWSDNFKTFGCSPKYIALYLAEHFPGKYDIVWVLERERPIPAELPDGIRVVRYFSMAYLKEIATAKVVVCNHRTGDYHFFRKRRGQLYIQTWHSSLRLKKIEGDVSQLPESYIAAARQDSQKIDLLLSGCRFSTDIFRRAFWYDGEILEKGTPRCDGFFGDNAAVKEKVYAYFGIPKDKKMALYAPTFRDDKAASLYGFQPEKLQESLGQDWVVGCRLHPNLNAEIPEGIAIPMSKYPDMQELLRACDLLITDYSSSMFDMAVAGKKCALYVPDLEKYMSGERGLYFDLTELPFPKAGDMAALCEAVTDFAGYDDRCAEFLKKIGNYEQGTAAREAAKWIEKVCQK